MKLSQVKVGILLNYVTIVLNIFVGLIYTPYMLRMMGQSEYGLYSIVASVISYLTVLDLGFGNAIIRYVAKYRAENKLKKQYELLGMFLSLYIIIAIIVIIIGCVLLLNIDFLFSRTMTLDELSKVKIMMTLMVVNLAVTFPFSVFSSVVQAYEKFAFQKLVNITRILLNTFVMVILLKLGYRAIAMVIVITSFNLLSLILNFIYAKYKLNIRLIFGKFNKLLLKEISIYSFWIFLMIIVNQLYWQSGQLILGSTSGSKSVAIFAVSIQLYLMLEQFSTAVNVVFLPRVTSMVSNGDNKSQMSDLFIKIGRLQFLIMSFIVSGFVLFGFDFIQLWAGDEYKDSYLICLLFMCPSVIPLSQNMGIVILQARNQMKFRALIFLLFSSVSCILQYFLSIQLGGLGCALGIACGIMAGQIIAMNLYYWKKQSIDIPKYWSNIYRMSILPIFLIIIVTIMRSHFDINISWTVLSIEMVCYSLIYLFGMYFMQMNVEEKQMVKLMIKR